jgi:hypothetical protein
MGPDRRTRQGRTPHAGPPPASVTLGPVRPAVGAAGPVRAQLPVPPPADNSPAVVAAAPATHHSDRGWVTRATSGSKPTPHPLATFPPERKSKIFWTAEVVVQEGASAGHGVLSDVGV